MTRAATTRVVNATVHLDDLGGQGVLVTGGFIVTATHCIKWSGEGGMAMGDHSVENISTKSGAHLKVGPIAADPVSDIALLGMLDDQVFFDESIEFQEWTEATPAVPLANITPRFGVPLSVQILTHKSKWIRAKIHRYSPKPPHGCLCIEADDRIQGGTSGGPVVDTSGRLVGVISHSCEQAIRGKYCGMLPIAHLALPRWAWGLAGPEKKARGPKAQKKPTKPE